MPISRLERIQEDFQLYSRDFTGRYRRMGREEFPDNLILLAEGNSTNYEEVVGRWLNGHPGERRWNFLQPILTATRLLDKINSSDPYLTEYIDRLADALEVKREKVLEGTIQTNALLKNRSHLPIVLSLQNGNCIVLGGRHLVSVSERSRTWLADLGYFYGDRTNRTGIRRSQEPNHYGLVSAQALEVNFGTLFLPVLCRSSYETGRIDRSSNNGLLQILTRRPVVRI